MMKTRFLLSFLFSFNGMMYELLLSQNLSAALGGTLFRYTITIGLFTLCLGVAAIIYDYIPETYKSIDSLYKINRFFTIGLFFLPLYFYLLESSLVKQWFSYDVFQFLYHAPLVIVALVTGFEIPYLFHGQTDEHKSQILAFDYVGMFLASVAFPIVFLEHIGLMGTFVVVMCSQVAAFLVIRKLSGFGAIRLAI